MKTIIQRPVLASIFFFLVILLGGYSLSHTPVELVPSPETTLPEINISYVWSGATPDMVLKRILIPAEGRITTVPGLAKISSEAQPGYGRIKAEFLKDTRMNFALVQLSERLNRLQLELPNDISKPQITPWVPREFSRQSAMDVGLTSDQLSLESLQETLRRQVLPALRAVPGVQAIEVSGELEPIVEIRTRLDRLNRHNLSIYHIQAALEKNFYTKPALTVGKNNKEATLVLSHMPDGVAPIRTMEIARMGEQPLRLEDVADVRLTYDTPQSAYRFQGKPLLGMNLNKEPGVSSLSFSTRIRDKLRVLANQLKGQASFVISRDESRDLRQQLRQLAGLSILILGIILLILLLIVRDLRAALLIFSSVFFSVFATFTVIYLFKISLNMLTLSGLALGFGLLVDNSVVVYDAILRLREEGLSPRDAAEQGATQVIMPVLASTFTTAIVFFSFALVFKDRLRVFYLPLAYVVSISLLSSIVVSFVLIPSLSARMRLKVRPRKPEKRNRPHRFMPFILRYPLTVLLPLAALAFFSQHAFFKDVSFGQFFGWYETDAVQASISLPDGAEFSDVSKAILKFEDIALKVTCPREITTTIYGNRASLRVYFPPQWRYTAYPHQLKQELVRLASDLSNVGVSVTGFDQEPYYYNPSYGSYLSSTIVLKGYHFDRLVAFANTLKNQLLSHRRVSEAAVETALTYFWASDRSKYFNLLPRQGVLGDLGIGLQEAAYALAQLVQEGRLSGQQKIRVQGQELRVKIQAEETRSIEMDDAMTRPFASYQGIPFRLNQVFETTLVQQKGRIERENQQYLGAVKWNYNGSPKRQDRFFHAVYDQLEVPPGFQKSEEENRFRMTTEEESQLWKSIWLSLLLIYLILGILYEDPFQPILIMLAIPLALVGVFLAFLIKDAPFDSSAYIGVILMSGIVVNNAIILVDHLNHHVRQGKPLLGAIARATAERVRPIFMTSATTVLGMLPMILITTEGKSDLWSSLALCTVGGLTSSALLVPLIIPILYYLTLRLEAYWRKTPIEEAPTPHDGVSV